MTPRHVELDIDQTHTPMVRKLMNNNSSAAIVLIDLLSRGRRMCTPVGDEALWCFTMLDSLEIYGADLRVFWADVCGCNTDQMLAVLRACHEGCSGVSRDTIMQAIACCNQVPALTESSPVP